MLCRSNWVRFASSVDLSGLAKADCFAPV